MEELLKVIKDNPSWKVLSKQKLIKKIRDEYDIPIKIINEYYDNREMTQVFKPPVSKKENQLVITAPPKSFQIDIVIYPGFKRYNNNIDKFLLIIDVISRKMWTYPLKDGTMNEVLDKYEQFIKDVDVNVNSVSGDNFFNNDMFITFNEELGIQVFTDVAKDDHITKQGNKLGIIDRAVRTLKNMLNKYMLEEENLKWTDYLDDVIDTYNNSQHRSLKNDTPNEVYDDDDYSSRIHEAQSKKNKKNFNEYDLQIGDKVRHLLGKNIFEKEKQKYSTEIYEIVSREGYRYKLKGEDGEDLKRLYRPNELQKVNVNSLEKRVNNKDINEAKKLHSNVLKARKEIDKDYNELISDIEQNKKKPIIIERNVVRNKDRVTRSGKVS